jgi:hypothetical protein
VNVFHFRHRHPAFEHPEFTASGLWTNDTSVPVGWVPALNGKEGLTRPPKGNNETGMRNQYLSIRITPTELQRSIIPRLVESTEDRATSAKAAKSPTRSEIFRIISARDRKGGKKSAKASPARSKLDSPPQEKWKKPLLNGVALLLS